MWGRRGRASSRGDGQAPRRGASQQRDVVGLMAGTGPCRRGCAYGTRTTRDRQGRPILHHLHSPPPHPTCCSSSALTGFTDAVGNDLLEGSIKHGCSQCAAGGVVAQSEPSSPTNPFAHSRRSYATGCRPPYDVGALEESVAGSVKGQAMAGHAACATIFWNPDRHTLLKFSISASVSVPESAT